jgi:mycothiol synthase
MDDRRYLIREFRDSDYDAAAAVISASEPDRPVSVESLRHELQSLGQLPGSILIHIVAEDRGSAKVVGLATALRMPFEDDPKRPWIMGCVLPSHRRMGIGARLYDTVLAEARRQGATGLRGRVREDSPDGRAFLAGRAFVERRRVWRSSLDVASSDTSGLPALREAVSATGVTFTSLSQEGPNDLAVLHRVHDLEMATGVDVPRIGEFTPVPFDEWREFSFSGPNMLPDAWFLAKDGDRFVGVSFASREPAQPEVLQQHYTATRREYRGKRIAVTLKLMLIDYAKRNGYARIETSNDSLNAPMWTINQRLGFRKTYEVLNVETEFRNATTP